MGAGIPKYQAIQGKGGMGTGIPRYQAVAAARTPTTGAAATIPPYLIKPSQH